VIKRCWLRVCGGLVIFREFISFHFILKVGSQRGVAKSQKLFLSLSQMTQLSLNSKSLSANRLLFQQLLGCFVSGVDSQIGSILS
jgi:hypothetical protein